MAVAIGYRGGHFTDVIHSIEMGIVNTAKIKALLAALDNLALVEQHLYPHRL